MRVLVLGHKGMLGHMVVKYLKDNNINVITIDKKYPLSSQQIKQFKGDYIINCIGAIPQKTNDFEINVQIPIWLDINTSCKIIHPGTDCEMDNDEYGKSKKMSAEWIKKEGKKTKIIKTSIFGPEINSRASLMEWFLSQKGEIDGYSQYYWNGNSTLTWAKYCLELMKNWDSYPIENILEGECISKYELLLILKTIYKKNIIINPITKPSHNKCLKGNIKTPRLQKQIIELKKYYGY